MTRDQQLQRDIELIEYLKNNSTVSAVNKFKLSLNHIYVIVRKYKAKLAIQT